MIARIWRGRVPAFRPPGAAAGHRGEAVPQPPALPRRGKTIRLSSIVKDHPGLESGVSMARCP